MREIIGLTGLIGLGVSQGQKREGGRGGLRGSVIVRSKAVLWSYIHNRTDLTHSSKYSKYLYIQPVVLVPYSRSKGHDVRHLPAAMFGGDRSICLSVLRGFSCPGQSLITEHAISNLGLDRPTELVVMICLIPQTSFQIARRISRR